MNRRTDGRVEQDASLASLCEAFSRLSAADETENFLKDLTTPAELRALCERWRIAQLLEQGALSYREIAAEVGGSPTTVARVARFLRDEPYQGYRIALANLGADRTLNAPTEKN